MGLNFEEPEHYGVAPRGVGYDLREATTLVFDVRATRPVSVGFSVGLCDTKSFFAIPRNGPSCASG